MKQNKTFVITLIITLLPVILVAAVYDRLPETVATHWGMDGNPDGWSPRWFLFLLPVLIAGLHTLCHFGSRYADPRVKNLSPAVTGLMYWIIPLVSVLCTAVTCFSALGTEIPMILIAQLLIGVIFVVVGNYLPKCRQNAVIGIKIPWTLNDAENWNFTHRVAGRVWMVCGAVMLISVFLDAAWVVLAALIVAVVSGFGASLWYKISHKA